MKIYVVCDLEGVAGVIDHRQQCVWDKKREWYAPFLQQARRMATQELNALVEGALEAGASEIIAWDGHGSFPGGLDVELLHPACKLVMGSGDGGPEGLDDSFDALCQIGLHAMAGTANAVMSHSFWPGIAGYYVNDMPVGEIWMNAFTAGMHGVPMIFMSGDKAGADEAQALVPGCETAVVKTGICPQKKGLEVASAISLSPEKAREEIKNGIQKALGKLGTTKPYFIPGPYTLKVEFTDPKYAKGNASRPGVNQIDDVTLVMENAPEPWLLI